MFPCLPCSPHRRFLRDTARVRSRSHLLSAADCEVGRRGRGLRAQEPQSGQLETCRPPAPLSPAPCSRLPLAPCLPTHVENKSTRFARPLSIDGGTVGPPVVCFATHPSSKGKVKRIPVHSHRVAQIARWSQFKSKFIKICSTTTDNFEIQGAKN